MLVELALQLDPAQARHVEFSLNGRLKTFDLPVSLTVTAAESYVAAAGLGLGIIQGDITSKGYWTVDL